MAAPTLATFYSPSHMGLTYGVKDGKHKNGHSGQDINGWPRGTRIPSFVAGRVVRRGSTSNFGNWISVQFGDLFAHFCHLDSLESAPALGTVLGIGSDAGPLGDTGYSFGNHLHAMVSASANPEAYAGVRDPLPYIKAALVSGGGGGGVNPPEGLEETMQIWQHKPTGQLAVVGENTFEHISVYTATYYEPVYGKFVTVEDPTWTFHSQLVARNQARMLAGNGGGGSGDPAAVAALIEQRLADDFARINANIDDQPTEFTLSPKS